MKRRTAKQFALADIKPITMSREEFRVLDIEIKGVALPIDVTKLAPIAGVASKRGARPPLVIHHEDRAKLTKLNARLSKLFFGGKKP